MGRGRIVWIVVALAMAQARAFPALDTLRVDSLSSFVLDRREIRSFRGDSLLARRPWSSSPTLAPAAISLGPDRGIVILDRSGKGSLVHLSPSLRIVSRHPLPSDIPSNSLGEATLDWSPGRGLVLSTAHPPRHWLLGRLLSPPRELLPGDLPGGP